MRPVTFICICLVSALPYVARSQGTIKGVVIDSKTKEPIPFAAVFLANTSLGASCDNQGGYLIRNIPVGKYQIVISSLGYNKLLSTVEVSDSPIVMNFELVPEVTQLQEVVVDVTDWEKSYRMFEKYFLGRTPNSRHCTIDNPDDINLVYDKEAKKLTATSDKPIIVKNEALGYKIYYLLDQFELDLKKGTLTVFGIPRFEDLVASSERQQRHWSRARDLAYYGSLRHFMKSMLRHQLAVNKFTILKDDHVVTEELLFASASSSVISFKGDLKVVYDGEVEDYEFRHAKYRGPQVSLLSFIDNHIKIYENGYFENPKSVMLNGYLGWSESMGEMVPMEYEPVSKK